MNEIPFRLTGGNADDLVEFAVDDFVDSLFAA